MYKYIQRFRKQYLYLSLLLIPKRASQKILSETARNDSEKLLSDILNAKFPVRYIAGPLV